MLLPPHSSPRHTPQLLHLPLSPVRVVGRSSGRVGAVWLGNTIQVNLGQVRPPHHHPRVLCPVKGTVAPIGRSQGRCVVLCWSRTLTRCYLGSPLNTGLHWNGLLVQSSARAALQFWGRACACWAPTFSWAGSVSGYEWNHEATQCGGGHGSSVPRDGRTLKGTCRGASLQPERG